MLLALFFSDYVAEIFETLMTTPKQELKAVKEEINNQIPEALHSKLTDKENKEDAKTKYRSRLQKQTVICPPTCSGL